VTPKDIGVLRQYGPLAATVTGGAAALGAFDEQPFLGEEDIESYATTGEDLLYSQPDRYMYNFADFVGRNPFYQRGPPSQTGTPTPTSSTPNLLASGPAQMGLGAPPNILAGTPYAQSASRKALNAYIAGAREGGAINGAGSGQSDSIPAMLSDGEFVMTAKAVRNAGNGDRRPLGGERIMALPGQSPEYYRDLEFYGAWQDSQFDPRNPGQMPMVGGENLSDPAFLAWKQQQGIPARGDPTFLTFGSGQQTPPPKAPAPTACALCAINCLLPSRLISPIAASITCCSYGFI